MPRNVAVDSGPLVALLVAADRRHAWARDQFASLRPPLLTCEPVLTEAAFVVGRVGGDPGKVLELVEKGIARVAINVQEQAAQLRALMRKYGDLPMSLADACLVRLTEVLDDAAVMTLDADFRVYRRHRRLVVPLIAPAGI